MKVNLSLAMYRKQLSENLRSHCSGSKLGKMDLSKIFTLEMERKINARIKRTSGILELRDLKEELEMAFGFFLEYLGKV